mgnify:CR=1 FL=1
MSAELPAILQLNERFLLEYPHEAARSLETLPVARMVETLRTQSPAAQPSLVAVKRRSSRSRSSRVRSGGTLPRFIT